MKPKVVGATPTSRLAAINISRGQGWERQAPAWRVHIAELGLGVPD